MSQQTWEETIGIAVVDQAAVTAAAEGILHADALATLPANYMYQGRVLKVQARGTVTTVATPGTFTYRLRWGGLAGIQLAVSAALTPTASVTTQAWMAEFLVVCRAVGAGTAGSLLTSGWIHAPGIGVTKAMIPVSANAAVGVDTTTQKVLSFTVTPTVATTTHVTQQFTLEAMN